MKGGQRRSFWQGKANSASSAVEKGERERGRKRKREKKGKADSARQSRVKEDRQCETTQTISGSRVTLLSCLSRYA